MQIADIIEAFFIQQEKRQADSPPALQVGDQLTAKVLRLQEDGRVLFEFGRFRALARAPVAVRPGQTIKLQVVQTGMPLQLRVMPQKAAAESRPVPNLNLSQVLQVSQQQQLNQIAGRLLTHDQITAHDHQMPLNVRQAVAALQALFEPIPVSGSTQQVTRWIRAALEDRGLFLEQKLADALTREEQQRPAGQNVPSQSRSAIKAAADVRNIVAGDLKAQLLLLKSYLAGGEPKATGFAQLTEAETTFLRQSVEQLLAHVTDQQGRAMQRSVDGESFQVYTFWMPVEKQPKPVRLKAYYPQKKGRTDGQTHHRMTLLLDMDRMGAVRADFSLSGRQLFIDFYVLDAAVKERIEKQSDTVVEALAGSFEQIRIRTYISRKKIERFDREDSTATAAVGIDLQV